MITVFHQKLASCKLLSRLNWKNNANAPMTAVAAVMVLITLSATPSLNSRLPISAKTITTTATMVMYMFYLPFSIFLPLMHLIYTAE